MSPRWPWIFACGALDLFVSIGSKGGTAWAMEGLAIAAIATGAPLRAVSCCAAADALRQSVATPPLAGRAPVARPRSSWGPGSNRRPAFEAAWRAGGALSQSAALAYARADRSMPAVHAGRRWPLECACAMNQIRVSFRPRQPMADCLGAWSGVASATTMATNDRAARVKLVARSTDVARRAAIGALGWIVKTALDPQPYGVW